MWRTWRGRAFHYTTYLLTYLDLETPEPLDTWGCQCPPTGSVCSSSLASASVCPSHKLTGRPCQLTWEPWICGLTRTHSLLCTMYPMGYCLRALTSPVDCANSNGDFCTPHLDTKLNEDGTKWKNATPHLDTKLNEYGTKWKDSVQYAPSWYETKWIRYEMKRFSEVLIIYDITLYITENDSVILVVTFLFLTSTDWTDTNIFPNSKCLPHFVFYICLFVRRFDENVHIVFSSPC